MSLYQDEYENSPFSAQSMSYLDMMYELYLEDPDVVLDASVGAYFDLINQNCERKDISHHTAIEAVKKQMSHLRPVQWVSEDSRFLLLACEHIVQWYENYGHYHANTGMRYYPRLHADVPQFSWDELGLNYQDRSSRVPSGLSFSVPEGSDLDALVQSLQSVFQSSIGYEYGYIKDQRAKRWLREQVGNRAEFTADEKRHFSMLLVQSEALELYLGRKYVGQKRFSIEGAESFILALESVIAISAKKGAEDVVIGMAHRGRLNTMVNILGLPCGDIDGWFQGFKMTSESISGDVKYHLGYSSDRQFADRDVHLTLNFNPSHLESIVPVTMGAARARQDVCENQDAQASVLPILVHGDASFTGQGVVAESLNMSYTEAYDVGGVIHIVINNQIGFTTTPEQSRSSYYCTDFAKIIDAPILHVNGDDPEAVSRAAMLAALYRVRFKKDIVIDLLTYRRHGHNEADEASATNPLIYNDIRGRASVAQSYLALLVEQGVYSSDDRKSLETDIYEKIKSGKSLVNVSTENVSKREISWKDHVSDNWRVDLDTGIPLDKIKSLGKHLSFLPDGFVLQKQVANMLTLREKMYAGDEPFNWGGAEALLFASLLSERVGIRLVGQDSCRGTFAHRHAVLHDQETGIPFVPCKQLSEMSGVKFDVYNSTLSEFAAMGFEYGYSSSSPKHLVLWEAQFGDFVNGAQVIIDQYLTSAWQKWARMSGLVLLLPHGYEGQGPEHSSARIERYLQLCAQNNIQVCMPSTPVQYFHLLRRQMLRKFRSPLVVMMPKSLLRNPASVSPIDQFIHDHFYLLLDDSRVRSAKTVKRVILCSGKVYYDIMEMIKTEGVSHIAVCRIEQLYPFPREELNVLMQKYASANTIVWCQEEPYNQGSWYVLKERIADCLLPRQTLVYAGRPKMASSAPGDYKQFIVQQKLLVRDALGINDVS